MNLESSTTTARVVASPSFDPDREVSRAVLEKLLTV